MSGHDHPARRDRLRGALAELGLDAMYVTAPENVRYLTGFTGSYGQVLVTRDDDLLITDHRYEQRAAAETGGLALDLTRDPSRAALEFVAPGCLGFESTHLSFRDGSDLQSAAAERSMEVRAVAGVVEGLRAVKDPHEIDLLARACAITSEVMRGLSDVLRPGLTELDVARHVEQALVDGGADSLAFPSIVASGPNGAIPHHDPCDRRLQRGDLVTCDIGGLVAGYHADMTRTFALGEPDARLRRAYAAARRAQAAGVDAVAPGIEASDVDNAVREVVSEAGFADAFLHGTGHGVGLQIHEAPSVSGQSTDTLAAQMVVTVEPGIYLPGIGGLRIEDTVVVSDDGPRSLTDAPHELLVL